MQDWSYYTGDISKDLKTYHGISSDTIIWYNDTKETIRFGESVTVPENNFSTTKNRFKNIKLLNASS